MLFTESYEIISHKILNEDIGEIENKDFKEVKKRKKIRGGFRMAYLLYDEAVANIIKSNIDFIIITRIREMFTYRQIENNLSPTQLAKDFNVSRQKISNLLKQMKEQKMILKVKGTIYRFNPFMYIPFRANAEELQREWDELSKQ